MRTESDPMDATQARDREPWIPTLSNRRQALRWLGLGAVSPLALAGCGGGGSDTTATTVATTTTTNTSGTSASSSATTGTATTATASTSPTATTSSTSPWVWASTGSVTTAKIQVMADFVQVIASGTVTYAFHDRITSTTTDPVTGTTTDSSTSSSLVPYWMGKYLVTNANWKAFLNAMGSSYTPSSYWSNGGYPGGKEDHPVLFISYTAAKAYCAWLGTQISGYVFYVPTEAEWEYAALGNNTGYSFPWGASANISYASGTGVLSTPYNCNAVCAQYVLNSGYFSTLTYYNDSTVTTLSDGTTALTNDTAPLGKVLSMNSTGGVSGWQYDSSTNKTWADFANSDTFDILVHTYGGYTTAVGAYPGGQSWCGCFDMAGNAYEWTSTINTATNGGEAGTNVNAIKGGSWYATSNSAKSSGRGEGRAPSGGYHSVGFRVAARTV